MLGGRLPVLPSSPTFNQRGWLTGNDTLWDGDVFATNSISRSSITHFECRSGRPRVLRVLGLCNKLDVQCLIAMYQCSGEVNEMMCLILDLKSNKTHSSNDQHRIPSSIECLNIMIPRPSRRNPSIPSSPPRWTLTNRSVRLHSRLPQLRRRVELMTAFISNIPEHGRSGR
jgi:hypothetical protein